MIARWRVFVVVLFVVFGVLAAALVSGAQAAGLPWWHMSSSTRPTSLEEGARGQVVVTAGNLGDEVANGAGNPVVLTDTLPASVKVVPCKAVQKPGCGVEAITGGERGASSRGPMPCTVQAGSPTSFTCTFEGTLPPFENIEVLVEVEVGEGASSLEANQASIAGGGAPDASVRGALQLGGEPSFGVQDYQLSLEEEGGAEDTQAGSHPFQMTTTLTLNQTLQPNSKFGFLPEPVSLTKDLRFKLPPGLIGNPTPIAQCTLGQFSQGPSTSCSPQSVVGAGMATVSEPGTVGVVTYPSPVYNLEPANGEPARFGFKPGGYPVYIDAQVRSGEDYGVTATVPNLTQTAAFLRSEVTLWGVPGDARHDNARGAGCLQRARGVPAACNPLEAVHPPPFLALPTSCTGNPLQTSVQVDSWVAAGSFQGLAGDPMPAMDSCNRLPFSASIGFTPDGTAASSPTGLTVGIHVPQDLVLNPDALAQSAVKDTTVVLPAGIALNPAAGDGLEACSEGLVGFTGFGSFEGSASAATFTPTLPEHVEPGVNFCADASKVGEVEIRTPLLPNPLKGDAYLAAQEANPFGSLVAMYVVAEDPVSGALVKLAGEVRLDPVSGQIVSTFANTPQLAFEDFRLHFFGGDRAPLATPAQCGSYTTSATITPWSGNPPLTSSSTFGIDSGPNGTPCANPLPFAPELTGGSINIQAGAFSPFTTTMSRADGNQSLRGIQLHMPPGLSGLLTGVKLCGEAQGNMGTCGPESLIGETTVSVGVGDSPFSVKGGRVYITGPYKGAPFGLSIVNPAKAGPYDLEKNTPCDCVVVRAKIEVDPITAALTVTTDNSGPYSIPTILAGIPLQIKHVNVTITRPGFTFNPTNCNPMAITGQAQSTEGASQNVSVPFQVTNCATLAFKPSFKVSTSGKTSRRLGASLKVNLAYPKTPFGSQANIKSVKVSLPRQLPSNLKAIQNACPHQTFEANPGACSSASRVGFAKATTPLLPVALEGPAYFVSYGGAKFPELVIVLQGYGVTLDLHGETFIDEHTNITSSTFHTIPDAPVGTFELNLPQGPFSALSAPTGVCNTTKTVLVRKKVTVRSKNGRRRTVTRKVKKAVAAPLAMPTVFTAQNGAQIKQTTPIETTGCARKAARKATRKAARQR
jgi:hypothetical protein